MYFLLRVKIGVQSDDLPPTYWIRWYSWNRWKWAMGMKTTVFSTPAAFVWKQTIKDLRATDVSGYAHAMLIRYGSVSDLVKHELDKCLKDYLDKIFTFTEFKVFRRIRIKCNHQKDLFKGRFDDVERFYQKSSQAFYRYLIEQIDWNEDVQNAHLFLWR